MNLQKKYEQAKRNKKNFDIFNFYSEFYLINPTFFIVKRQILYYEKGERFVSSK